MLVSSDEDETQKTQIKVEKPRIKCPQCDSTFESGEGLRLHKKGYHSGLIFVCNVCGKMHGHQTNLDRHLRIHTDQKAHRLEITRSLYSNPSFHRAYKYCFSVEKLKDFIKESEARYIAINCPPIEIPEEEMEKLQAESKRTFIPEDFVDDKRSLLTVNKWGDYSFLTGLD